jgi:hypothetical protein
MSNALANFFRRWEEVEKFLIILRSDLEVDEEEICPGPLVRHLSIL